MIDANSNKMELKFMWIILLLSMVGVNGVTPNCPMKCSLAYNPVCASDGQTYINACNMRKIACILSKSLKMAHFGICMHQGDKFINKQPKTLNNIIRKRIKLDSFLESKQRHLRKKLKYNQPPKHKQHKSWLTRFANSFSSVTESNPFQDINTPECSDETKTHSIITTPECSTETETPSTTPECSTETETPSTTPECSTETETPSTTPECSTETETPSTTPECSTETETPSTTPECSTETETPSTTPECSTETETPSTTPECSTETEIPSTTPECSTETETPSTTPECSTETETPSTTPECSTETETPSTTPECSTETETPSTTPECSTETETPSTTPECSTETETPSTTPECSTETETPSTTPECSTETETPSTTPECSTETETPSTTPECSTETETPSTTPECSTETETPSTTPECSTETETSSTTPECSTETETPSTTPECSTETETPSTTPECLTETETPLTNSAAECTYPESTSPIIPNCRDVPPPTTQYPTNQDINTSECLDTKPPIPIITPKCIEFETQRKEKVPECTSPSRQPNQKCYPATPKCLHEKATTKEDTAIKSKCLDSPKENVSCVSAKPGRFFDKSLMLRTMKNNQIKSKNQRLSIQNVTKKVNFSWTRHLGRQHLRLLLRKKTLMPTNKSHKSDSNCNLNCTNVVRPVCGCDGIIYKNLCCFRKEKCLGKKHIWLVRNNKCKNFNSYKLQKKQSHLKFQSNLQTPRKIINQPKRTGSRFRFRKSKLESKSYVKTHHKINNEFHAIRKHQIQRNMKARLFKSMGKKKSDLGIPCEP